MVTGLLRFLARFGPLLALPLAFAPAPHAAGQSIGLLREVWEGIGGASVSHLTSAPDFPDRPTSRNYVTDFFEAPTDVLENYGQRMHGYVIPPSPAITPSGSPPTTAAPSSSAPMTSPPTPASSLASTAGPPPANGPARRPSSPPPSA